MFAVERREGTASSPEAQSPSHRRPSVDAESEAKRRKVRKGTRSCWECKRRKVRCTFASEADQVCNGCRRRGGKCVSQEYPEASSGPVDRSRQMGDRIVRVEALVEHLVKTVSTAGAVSTGSKAAETAESSRPSPHPCIPTPSSSDSEPAQARIFRLSLNEPSAEASLAGRDHISHPSTTPHTLFAPSRISPANAARYEAISAALCAAYPSREDLNILKMSEAGKSGFFKHLLMIPYPIIERDGIEDSAELFELPDPKSHPVMVGKRMLKLAAFLQFYNPDLNPEARDLSRNPHDIMRALAEAVIRLVTTNDEFLGTIDGLECVMLEGMYQGNSGNLRRSWLAFRRAMVVAQLMGIHRNCQHQTLKSIEPNAVVYPYFVWSRIVYVDRVLSMMLGLPQGSLDRAIASPAALADDTPLGQLERMHSVISSKILERNESDPNLDDYATTQAIDLELQEAAKQLPGKWWLTPNLSKIGTNLDEQFWETLRLLGQLFHYHLLNSLHLPYMLRSQKEMAGKYEYSKATCVTASREILSRFIMFRSHNRVPFCCRTVDFYALMAAMTLLLVHVDGHRQPKGANLLTHQRLADRAMMEDVLENMELVRKHSSDMLSEKSGILLRRLLDIEEEAADGRRSYQTSRLHGPEAGQPGDENVLRISIPYFGTVNIAPEGVISKTTSQMQPQQPIRIGDPDVFCEMGGADSFGALREDGSSGTVFPPVSVDHEPEMLESELPPMIQNQSPGSVSASAQLSPKLGQGVGQPEQYAPQFSAAITDSLQQYDYPALTAGADDWTFQGVDLAFFDTLMRGAGTVEAGGEGGEGWGDWEVAGSGVRWRN